MKIYLVALAAGLLVSVFCGLLNVRSPTPPIVALVGRFDILLGEQMLPIANRLLAGQAVGRAEVLARCAERMFGQLLQRPRP